MKALFCSRMVVALLVFSTCNSARLFAATNDIAVQIAEAADPIPSQIWIEYTITVTNAGPDDAANVTLTNTLPNGPTLVSASVSQGTYSNSGGAILCQFGTVAALSNATLTIQLQPPGIGIFTNKAVVASGGVDLNLANNAVTETTTVASNKWYPIGPMDVGRYQHTSLLLPDGRVLLSGGSVKTLTTYNSVSLSFSMVPGATNIDYGPSASVLLTNGTVLMISGHGDSYAEIFDPSSGLLHRTEDLGANQSSPTATVLADGRVLALAGDFYEGRGEVYDPIANTWSVVGSMTTTRISHTTTLLPNGKVLVAGGFSINGGLQSAELFDPATGTFTLTGSMSMTRYSHTATLLANGKVLIAGGQPSWVPGIEVCELYDPIAGTFTPTTSLNRARAGHAATVLPGNKVLLVGGVGNSTPSGYLSSAEIYDMGTGLFSLTVDLNLGREGLSAVLLTNGMVLATGGANSTFLPTASMYSAEIYDTQGLYNAPTISVTNTAQAEGNIGTNNLVFNIRLSRTSAVPVSVNFTTASGTAKSGYDSNGAGYDYYDTSGTLTFPPGTTNQALPVQIRCDTIYEPDETFTLTLGAPLYGLVAGHTAIGTILNDDAPPIISITAVTNAVPEGDSGVTYAQFVVNLSSPSALSCSVDYATSNGTATAGVDYLSTSGTLTFAPGETTKTVSVAVVGDLALEADETFFLSITNSQSASIQPGHGVAFCTILNDDGIAGKLHHFDVSAISSPQLQGVPFAVKVTARDINGRTVSTFGGPALLSPQTTNVIAADLDFEQQGLGPWVPLNTSDYPGPYEVVPFDIAGNGIISTAFRTITGAGTDGITQNIWLKGGIAYTFSVNLAAAMEGGGGCWAGGGVAMLQIDNTNATWYLPDLCTGQSARTTLSVVYQPASSGFYPLSITFSRVYSADMSYATYADNVQISSPQIVPTITSNFVNGVWNGQVTAMQAGTNVILLADDTQGHKGSSNPFDIQATSDLGLSGTQLWNPSLRTGDRFTFNLTVTNRGPSTVSDATIISLLPSNLRLLSSTNNSGTVTNSVGSLQWKLGALAKGSSASAGFEMRADIPGGITNVFAVSSTLVELNPNDNAITFTNFIFPPILTINSTSGLESPASATGMVFSITLSGASAQTVSADYRTMDGTAFAGIDYVATNGTVTFPPFTTNASIRVFAVDNDLNQPSRTFSVWLTNLTNAVIGYDNAPGTILDDDLPPVVTIADTSLLEGDSGTTNAIFQLSISKHAIADVTVYFNTSDGTASSTNNDYISTFSSVVFPAGTTTNQTISIPVRGNTVNEPDETFFVNLTSIINATLGNNRATCTILNDDAVAGRLDHFLFGTIPSPQYAGRGFQVIVRAADYAGNPAPFSGQVTLTAQTDQYYIQRLYDDFESGTLSDWTNFAGGTQVASNVTDTAASGTHSLKITGKASSSNVSAGLRRQLLTNSRPTGISFYARAAQTNAQCNRVTALGSALYRAVDFYMNKDGRMGIFGAGVFNGVPYSSNRWYKIDIGLDWNTRRTTCSVDGALVITNVAFPDDPYSGTDFIMVQNVDAATNWLDQIHIYTLANTNLGASPTLLSGFINGNWTGTVAVAQSATNCYLSVADTAEHIGRSTNFDLLPVGIGVIAPAAVTEGSPPVAAQVTLPFTFPQAVVVGLTSSIPSELTVPATVTIPAGQTNAIFNITIIDDTLLDGSQLVTISAGATNLITGSAVVSVDDNEVAALSVSLPATAVENMGTLINQGRVSCSAAPSKAVTVLLTSSDTSSVTVPPSVTITAGQTAANFSLTLVDNTKIDGTRLVSISTYVANWTNGSQVISVTDNEDTVIRLSGPGQVSEESGAVTFNARISGTLSTNLLLTLSSSDTNVITVPATVPILAGQTTPLFTATVIDNTNYDGAKVVTLTCSAPGFTTAISNITVLDNEIHHLGFSSIIGPKTNSVAFAATVSARDIADGFASAFNGPVTLSASGTGGNPVLVQPSQVVLVNGLWSGSLTLFTAEQQVTLFAASTNGLVGQSAPFSVAPPTVAVLNVAASDLAYSDTSHQLYASAISSGTFTPINPFSLTVGTTIPVGALAGRICASDDGQFVFAALTSSNRICQFDVTSKTVVTAWNLNGNWVEDMAPVKGNPAAIAVSRRATNSSPRYRGMAIYDNGIARSNSDNSFLGANVIEPSDTATRMYGYDNESSPANFQLFKVDAGGVTLEKTLGFLQGFGLDFVAGGGRIFVTTGQIYDPERGVLLGNFPNAAVRPDAASGRYYVCRFTPPSGPSSLGAYDLKTLLPVGSVSLPVNTGTGSLMKWGSNGLAFRVNSSQVALVRTPLIATGPPANLHLTFAPPTPVGPGGILTYSTTVSNQGPNTAQNAVFTQTLPNNTTFISAVSSSGVCTQINGGLVCSPVMLSNGASLKITIKLQTLDAGLMTCVASATSDTLDTDLSDNSLVLQLPVISPPAPDSVVELRLTATDLAWEPVSGKIFASVPNADLNLGNSLVSFDPATFQFDSPIPTGIEPAKLAVSDNGQYMYAGINSDNTIQRVVLANRIPDLRFPTGYSYVADMAVMPGNPEVVVATAYSTFAVYESGVQRSGVVGPFYPYNNFEHYLAASATGALFYEAGPAVFRKIQVDSSGASLSEEVASSLIPDMNDRITFDAGLIFSTGGRVIDPQANTVVTNLPFTGICRPDTAHGRVFYLTLSGTIGTLHAVSISNFTEVGTVAIPNISGTVSSLIRWGTDGLAFRTSGGQVFLVRSILADDRDQNGLPDTWEIQQFGALGTPGGGPNDDPDGDGFTNLQEYRYGLVPTHFDAVQFLASRKRSDGTFEMTVLAVPGNSYALIASTNLSDWSAILKFTSTNFPTILIDPAGLSFSQRYYRIVPVSSVPGPRLRLISVPSAGTGAVGLSLEAVSGFSYQILYSTNLTDWSVLTNFSGTNSTMFFQDPAGNNSTTKFYRARAY